jgi:FkbM family methyltransferase
MIKTFARSVLPPVLFNGLRRWFRPEAPELSTIRGLKQMPRYQAGTATVVGAKVQLPDGPSAAYAMEAIFHRGIYAFTTSEPAPTIVDCGANIGLSVLFFKRQFPAATVIAFEADPQIFAFLRQNVGQLPGVELHEAAVWTANTQLTFASEGADSGSIASVHAGKQQNTITVPGIRLRDRLDRGIALLKLDIEGAEVDVLVDCADRLSNVQRIFVEYHSIAGRPQRLAEMLSVLDRAGFRLHIQPEMVAPQPFVDAPVDAGHDQRLNIFAFRPQC